MRRWEGVRRGGKGEKWTGGKDIGPQLHIPHFIQYTYTRTSPPPPATTQTPSPLPAQLPITYLEFYGFEKNINICPKSSARRYGA